MKFTPCGIVRDAGIPQPCGRESDYSSKLYDGIRLYRDGKQRPVIISRCKRSDPLPWRIVYGFSSVFFRTFEEAVAFCNTRDMTLVQSEENSHV